MYACLAVTCHLHFWQNDRDFLRATVVTRGWNGYRNKSQHRKSTLEKKILPPFQQGFEPATFQSRVRCSNHWAIPAPFYFYFTQPVYIRYAYYLCWDCDSSKLIDPSRPSGCSKFKETSPFPPLVLSVCCCPCSFECSRFHYLMVFFCLSVMKHEMVTVNDRGCALIYKYFMFY